MEPTASGDPDNIRARFEANRRKFREQSVGKAWAEISEGRKTIPVDQFGSVCFKVDSSMNKDAVAKAIGEIDTDGDGTIDLGEFRVWYMKKLDADDEKAETDREAGYGAEDEWDEIEMHRQGVIFLPRSAHMFASFCSYFCLVLPGLASFCLVLC